MDEWIPPEAAAMICSGGGAIALGLDPLIRRPLAMDAGAMGRGAGVTIGGGGGGAAAARGGGGRARAMISLAALVPSVLQMGHWMEEGMRPW